MRKYIVTLAFLLTVALATPAYASTFKTSSPWLYNILKGWGWDVVLVVQPKPVPTPTPALIPRPEPVPVPAPQPIPEPKQVPQPTPAPQPIPVPEPQPTPQPVPEPKTEPTPTPAPIPVHQLNAFEQKVVDLVNSERQKAGLKSLDVDPTLSKMAREKSRDMAVNRYFAHTSPTYGSPFDMMKAWGIFYRSAGENIASGYKTPEAVVNGWMNSDGHRKNIMSAKFSHIGVGYYYTSEGNYRHYWTQEFIGR